MVHFFDFFIAQKFRFQALFKKWSQIKLMTPGLYYDNNDEKNDDPNGQWWRWRGSLLIIESNNRLLKQTEKKETKGKTTKLWY